MTRLATAVTAVKAVKAVTASTAETSEPEDVCPTRKHFIHPTVAFSVKGKHSENLNYERIW